ncbi:MAG: alpha/beta hydrolase [Spirochaetes bacterium]|nr:alpha/beta hydrolase [Spirochaetota bacterium]
MEYNIHGMSIYYEIIGSGLPVFMIHGNGPDNRSLKGCMEPCFSQVDYKFQRIYFDLPGYGKSIGNNWLSNADKLIELILSFISSLIYDQPFVLIGNSYGGYLALCILNKVQERVKGLFLLCPSLHMGGPKPDFIVLEKEPDLDGILSLKEKSYFNPIVVRQTNQVWLRYKEEIIPGLALKDSDFYNTWAKSAYSVDVNVMNNEFSKPTLILLGKQDSLVGYKNSLNVFQNFPRATLALLDTAGHALQLEQPELFTSLTKEWLERIIKAESTGA